MNELSSMLREHVAAASPPLFDAVLRRVRRRRQRQIVGTALGVVLVVSGVAFAVGRPTPSARPQPAASGSPLPGVGTAPAAIVLNGKRLPLLHPKPVNVVLVDSLDSTSVRIKARGVPDEGDALACGIAYRAFLLGQDARSVRVGVYLYGPGLVCWDDPGSTATGARDLTVPLGIPLGGRTVSTAGSSREAAVLATDTVLRATTLPGTFTRQDEVVDVAPGQSDPYDVYRWQSRAGSLLSLIQGTSPAGMGIPFPNKTSPVTVRGRAGSELFHHSYTDTRCLRWYEGRVVTLCSQGKSPLATAQLQSIAEGLQSKTSAHDSSLVHTTVDLDGSTFQLVGDQAVEVVYATDRDDQLLVRAGRDTTRAECGPIARSFVLSEDDAAVRIGTYSYQGVGGGGGSCPPPGEAQQVLQLEKPVGHRKVVAVTDFNREVPVIDEHDFLVPSYLPEGVSGRSFVGGRTRLAEGYARQTWQVSGSVVLTLDEGPLPGEVRALGPVVGNVTAHGHAADVVQQRGFSFPVRCLRWHESEGDEVQLCSRGVGQRSVLPDSELRRIAEGLRRP